MSQLVGTVNIEIICSHARPRGDMEACQEFQTEKNSIADHRVQNIYLEFWTLSLSILNIKYVSMGELVCDLFDNI